MIANSSLFKQRNKHAHTENKGMIKTGEMKLMVPIKDSY